MSSEDFFNLLDETLEAGIAMVSYRLPGKDAVQLLSQTSNDIFRIKDFSESGFVFAPFQNTEKPLFIPEKQSKKTVLPFFERAYIQDNSTEKTDSDLNSKAKFAHINLVGLGIDTIKKTELEKVVLSRKELQETNISASKIFQNLLSLYPNAFVYMWSHPETGIWLGATPETLLKTNRTKFSTMSLAGTRKLKNDTFHDWTEKERNEQQIVTDSILLELQQLEVSENELKVSKPYTSEAGNLVHLRTDISGTFKNNSSEIGTILKALHPTPAVCGLPKKLAAKFILEQENYAREYYTGYLGELNMITETKRNSRTRNQENQAYTSIRKDSSLYVNLRCMKFKNQAVEIFVGGGITKDSNSQAEWKETVNKTRTMKAAL